MRLALAASAAWFLLETGLSHHAREGEVGEYEKNVVYLCVHWSDGLPLMPRQSPEKCYRKHVVDNPVRKEFIASGWTADGLSALLSLAGLWVIGALAILLFRLLRWMRGGAKKTNDMPAGRPETVRQSEQETRVAEMQPIMTVPELERFMDTAFPQMHEGGRLNVIEAVGPGMARLRLLYSDRNLRPGGTLSGPSMMALADYAMYAVVLAHIGPVALAVTTNLNINFLRKPGPADLVAEAKLLKLGRRLAVGDVLIWQEGLDGPVAHVTSTYSIPPERGNASAS